MSDPLDPFGDDFDDVVRRTARNSLLRGAAAAVGLACLQFCCNPIFIVSILAVGASLHAIRLPRQFMISLDAEERPGTEMTISTVCGVIGLVITGLNAALIVLNFMGWIAVTSLQ